MKTLYNPKKRKTKNEELAFTNCVIIIYIIIYNIIIYIKVDTNQKSNSSFFVFSFFVSCASLRYK